MAPRALGIVALVATSLGWGLGWLATKLVLQTWPPLFSRGVAGLAAAVLLVLAARARGEALGVPAGARGRLALAAFTNVFAWMGLSALCLRWLGVGEGTLLVYSMPIWATLLDWLLRGRRPSAGGLAALALGLAGLTVLIGIDGELLGAAKLPGVAVALASALLFALGAVLNGTPLPMPPLAQTAWQVGLGCLPLAAIGLALEQPRLLALDAPGAAALAYMTVFPMAICYLTWFAAVDRLGPAAAATSILLVPLTGLLAAALLMGEPFGAREALAMALTLGGVLLALRRERA